MWPEFQCQRVLLLERRGLIVYHRSDGPLLFAADDAGRTEFCRYLQVHPGAGPAHLIVDGSEERFRLEKLPRVRSAERRQLLQRYRQRLFPGAAHVRTELRGSRAGRPDGQTVLFSCLANTEAIQSYTRLLQRYHVPLAGIHSAPWLLGRLLKRLGLRSRCLLLLSVHAFGGLRQSCFLHGIVRLSRLSLLPSPATEATAESVLQELDKMLRFLRKELPELDGEAAPQLAILGAEPLLDMLRGDLPADLQLQSLSFTDATRLLRLPGTDTPADCDALLAQVLFLENPGPGYAAPAEVRQLRRLRREHGAWMLGLYCLLAALLCAPLLLLQAERLRRDTAELVRQQAEVNAHRVELRRQNAYALPEAVQLRQIITYADALQDISHSPFTLWALIGAGLQTETALELKRLEWSAPLTVMGLSSPGMDDAREKRAQAVLQLSSGASADTMDTALHAVRRFAAWLREQDATVELLHSPLQHDTAQISPSGFSLRVWGPPSASGPAAQQ